MAPLQLHSRLIITFMLAALLSPLQLPALQAEELSVEQLSTPTAHKSETSEGETGKATYYARRYQNRRTSSGERHDEKRLTAAHGSLPLGTKVRVINLANRKEVVVTINDRCRPRSLPFIDLSRSAAKKLGFLGKGSARVRIIPLDKAAS